jgi:hypothetical protein
MLIFASCIVLGALLEMILTSFSVSSFIVMSFGLILAIVNLAGNKLFKGIGKNILSLLIVLLALLIVTAISSMKEPLDKEIRDKLNEAESIEEEQDYQAALEFLQNNNSGDGWRKETALRIGEIYMEQALYTEGADTYYQILRKMPDDMAVRTLYSEALYMKKNYKNTLKQGMHMAKLDPGYSKAYIIIGDAYKGYNDHFREIFYYKIAVDLDRESIANRIRLAEAYASSQSQKEAVEQYEIAKELADTFEENNLVYESYISFVATDSENSEDSKQEVQ